MELFGLFVCCFPVPPLDRTKMEPSAAHDKVRNTDVAIKKCCLNDEPEVLKSMLREVTVYRFVGGHGNVWLFENRSLFGTTPFRWNGPTLDRPSPW